MTILQKLHPPRTLFTSLLLLGLAALLPILLLVALFRTTSSLTLLTAVDTTQHRISPILHSQNLSHGSFHNPYTKSYLLDLVTTCPNASVIIIGLARGGEALAFSKTHHVHAIEPLGTYVKRFRQRPSATTRNVTLYPLAASDHDHQLVIRYRGMSETVPARRLDGVLPSSIRPAVISVDVQGAEYPALLGLGDILNRTNSVWVEVGCGSPDDTPLEMLKFLDERFQLFDFVPWGKRPDVDETWDKRQFVWGKRPDGIEEWVQWICEARQQFQWLQTDIVGIKRELLRTRPQIIRGLVNVAQENCRAGCYLREHAIGS